MVKEYAKQYIYIIKATNEFSRCKIGITKNLEKRLKEYNNTTGVSIDNRFEYLFTCEVTDMRNVETDIKKEFRLFREVANKEIYLFNADVFENYVKFIKSHNLFREEIFLEKKEENKAIEKIIKRQTPSLKERKLTPKDVMQQAQKRKNDEFYTRYEDIEKEIAMYDKKIWKDKCVFCNCDDAVGNDESRTSAFALYFLQNFNELKLKKLICTHYGGGDDIFFQGARGYIFTIDGFIEIKDCEKYKVFSSGYTGSFDHPESIRILTEEADIVCTNPPFSRARDYWKLITESGKKFLIISNIANILTSGYTPYFFNNTIWAGYNRVDWFLNPKKQLTQASGHWYTNISIKNRPKYKHLKIVPLAEIPKKFKQYDDSKTLLVDNCYIPDDYKKPFAVSARPILNGLLEKGYKLIEDKEYYPYINGKKKFARVLVQNVEV